MNNLMTMSGEFGVVRTTIMDNEIWFVGKDVAKCLGYSNTSDALKNFVDTDDKKALEYKAYRESREASQLWDGNDFSNKTLINESGLYSLVLSSKLPNAKKFKKWITSEVLPSIRRNGMYATEDTIEQMLNDPDFAIGLLTKLKEERTEKKRLEELNRQQELKIEQDKPLVEFANQVSSSSDSILVRQFAKLLTDENIKLGERKLYQWFRDNGYVCKNSTEPTQKSINQGLFEIVERTVKTPYGEKLTQTTKISGKGQIYFTEKLREEINK